MEEFRKLTPDQHVDRILALAYEKDKDKSKANKTAGPQVPARNEPTFAR